MVINPSLSDARSIFSQCLLKVGEVYAYVLDITGDAVQHLLNVETGEAFTVRGDDFSEYSALTERLGYVNLGGHCVWLSRGPSQQYKYSLHEGNLQFGHSAYDSPLYNSVKETVHTLRNNAIIKCLKNEYPSLMDCITAVRGDAQAMAFDKQFCINRELRVFYRGLHYPVGRVRDGKVVFFEDFKYLNIALNGVEDETD